MASARKLAYTAYLRSEHWANLIRLKSTHGGDQCLGCRRYDGLHLHHMVYRERWEDALLTDLCWLCPNCHQRFHAKHKAMHPAALTMNSTELERMTLAVINPAEIRRQAKQRRVARKALERKLGTLRTIPSYTGIKVINP